METHAGIISGQTSIYRFEERHSWFFVFIQLSFCFSGLQYRSLALATNEARNEEIGPLAPIRAQTLRQ